MKRHALMIAAFVALLSGSAAADTLTDQRGKTLTFDQPATRVVHIAIPLFWTYVLVDGTADHVIGANSVAIDQMKEGIFAKVFPGADRVPTNITRGGTFTPNIETLIALKPDVVFQWADRGDELIAALERVGIKTVGVWNNGKESDIDIRMRMSGVVAGKQARAEALIAWQQDANRRFAQMTAVVPESQRPKVLMMDHAKGIRPNGPGSYFDAVLRRAGGLNASPVDNEVDIEEVLRWAPEVIFLTQFETMTPADVFADPVWRSVPAVKSRRVYKLPFGLTRWGGYDVESPLFLAWMTELFYPGRFGLSVRTEMRAAYEQKFNFKATDQDIDQVLNMRQNGGSAHYDVFGAAP